MSYPKRDVVGMRFNMVTVLSEVATSEISKRKVIGRCDCGVVREFNLYKLTGGVSLSCGCRNKTIKNTTHCLTHHPIYNTWKKMKDRCYNPHHNSYKDYGGRGIVICDEWLTDNVLFFSWAFENGWERGLQIDRINNNGNYEPSNCRFVTAAINACNKKSNIMVSYKGESKALSQWCKIFGFEHETMRYRIMKKKMSPELAFTIPVGKIRKT